MAPAGGRGGAGAVPRRRRAQFDGSLIGDVNAISGLIVIQIVAPRPQRSQLPQLREKVSMAKGSIEHTPYGCLTGKK